MPNMSDPMSTEKEGDAGSSVSTIGSHGARHRTRVRRLAGACGVMPWSTPMPKNPNPHSGREWKLKVCPDCGNHQTAFALCEHQRGGNDEPFDAVTKFQLVVVVPKDEAELAYESLWLERDQLVLRIEAVEAERDEALRERDREKKRANRALGERHSLKAELSTAQSNLQTVTEALRELVEAHDETDLRYPHGSRFALSVTAARTLHRPIHD